MHVDQHQAARVLRQDVDAVQLGQREAEREVVVARSDRRCRHRHRSGRRRPGRGIGEQGAVVGRALGDAARVRRIPAAARREGRRREGLRELGAEGGLLVRTAPVGAAGRRDLGGADRRRGAAVRGGRGGRERALHRVEHELVHCAAVAEAHFDFRRMHVDVDQRRIEVERQHVGRKTVAVQHVLVSGAHRVHQQLVAHVAPVHIKELAVGARLRGGRQAGIAEQAQGAGRFVDRQARLGEIAAQDLGAALGHLAGVPVVDGASVVGQAERHVGTRQRDAAHDFGAVAIFRLFAFQEFAARRGIEVQVLHVDGGAAGAGRGRNRALVRADDFPGVRCVGRPCRDRHRRHRGDRGERLAAKTEGRHVLEVGERGDLRGRMARQRERQLLGGDAAAVVGDRNALDAAFFQADRDLRRARVERVFEQLLDDCRGPFDHLAGGDLRDQLVIQLLDGAVGGDGRVHAAIIAPGPTAYRGALISPRAPESAPRTGRRDRPRPWSRGRRGCASPRPLSGKSRSRYASPRTCCARAPAHRRRRART